MSAEQVARMATLKRSYMTGKICWDEYQKEAYKLEDEMKGRKPPKEEKK